jgi:GH25 family lysozyme M1 (1,4-beta-N-acetylmuramidase)
MKSYAKENIKKYQTRQRNEAIKTIAYHFAETLTAVAIFAFGFLYFSIAI